MANQAKPDVNTIWGSAGLATAISKAKQALGWVAEIPEYDQFNGMLQQISQFQQHVNQEGVPLWDALTTYGIGSIVKSPVDRSIYRCLSADQLNVPPVLVVGGAVNTNWVKLAHTDAEIQALIGLYGVTAGQLQSQLVTAFTTAGVAPTLTLTPAPAVAAYAANQRFRVKFNVASLPGVNTLNVSGRGAVSVKQYDSTGAKIDAVWAVAQLGDVEYDGVDFILLDPLPTPNSVPVGTIISVAGSAVPTGFLKANGAVVLRTAYPNLFSAIGTLYGAGDGATTFGLPDMRGVFTRHWDDGRGIDVGRALGSGQTDDFKSHTHLINGSINFTYALNPTPDFKYFSSGGSTSPTAATGGTETRPRNLALHACIKF